MKRSTEMAIYNRSGFVFRPSDGEVMAETRPEQVRVMARAEGYALVRTHGCVPFAVSEKDLSPAAPEGEHHENR